MTNKYKLPFSGEEIVEKLNKINTLAEKIEETKASVGDIKETIRIDLNDEWVLCNGDVVPEGTYPELREVLPYNTSWRQLPPGSEEYTHVRPLPIEGQWLFMKEKVNPNQKSNNDTALLYDENTTTFTTINCPLISGALDIGIFGLTHDGEKYVLGTCSGSMSLAEAYVAHFYTSTDLINWSKKLDYTLPYTNNGHTAAVDLTYNGESVIFTTYYYYWYSETNNAESGDVYYLDGAMTKVTKYNLSYSAYVNFVALPHPYWAAQSEDSTSFTVRKGTASGSVFSFSNNAKVAFFSDRFWVGYPGTRMYIADLTTETMTSLSLDSLTGDSSTNLSTVVYDVNTREWCLHLSKYYYNTSPAYYKYWLAYISEDANPREASNYRVVAVNELPSDVGATQMTPNRTRFRNDSTRAKYIQNPNIKCLPTHSGDTYKYIYLGNNEQRSVN